MAAGDAAGARLTCCAGEGERGFVMARPRPVVSPSRLFCGRLP